MIKLSCKFKFKQFFLYTFANDYDLDCKSFQVFVSARVCLIVNTTIFELKKKIDNYFATITIPTVKFLNLNTIKSDKIYWKNAMKLFEAN